MSASSSISSWLTGKPVRSKQLLWPSNDEIIRAGVWDRQGTSLLNGLVLHWFSFTRERARTVVYLADIRSHGSEGEVEEQEPIVLSPIAKELEYATDRIVLVGPNEIASAEWVRSDRTLRLRLHSFDGSLVRDDSISVQAVFGELHVFGSEVSICVSSGPTNALEGALTPDHLRLGSDTDTTDADPPNGLFADLILEWDTTSGAFRRVKIPNPIRHGAAYSFLTEHMVALAGLVDDQDAQEQLALTCFNVNDQLQSQSASRSFSPGGTSQERIIKGMGIGIEGNTEPTSDIIVHSFDRIAVFDRAFFSRDIPDNPRTGRFHYLRSLLINHDVRVLSFALSGSLPAITNNRVLAYQKVSGKYLFYILDFDQQRVNVLLSKTPEEREALRADLAAATTNTRVKVVTRQFYAQEEGVGGGSVDAEYPIRRVPPEWREHLKGLAEQEKEGVSLIFDEAPEGRREGRFGYVQTQLSLGRDIPSVGVGRMGVTNDCVVLVPEPGDSGVVWYFE